MSQTPRLALGLLLLALVRPALGQNESDKPGPLAPRKPLTKKELARREAQKLFGVAGLHERANRLVEAIRAYEEAAKLDPDSAAIPRALFGLYVALDRSDDAILACKKVLRLDPDDCQTAYLLSRQLRGLDRKKEAVEAMEQASKSPRLKERPELAAQVWFDLGVMYEQDGEWAKAEKALRQVVALLEQPQGLIDAGKYSREEINTQAAETLERIGKVCLKAGRVNDAIKAFEAAKKKDALRAPRLALNLAQVYRDQNKPREALAQLDVYLAGQPQGVEAYEMKGELLRRLGRAADVVPSLEAASGRDPHNVALRLLLARELRKARRADEARTIYNTLLETTVTPEVYRGLFELNREQGAAGVTQVIDLLDHALTRAAGDEEKKVAPSSSDARRARAMLQALRDDAPLVRVVLQSAVGRVSRKELHYTTRGVLATLAARTKQLDHAETLYRGCLDRPGGLRGSEAEVYLGLLRVLRLGHKHAETVKVCKQGLATAQQTNRILFHTELVHAYQALNDHKSALAAADAAVTDAGKGSLLMCKRVRLDALLAAGQKDKALAECQEMLKEYNSGSDLRDVRYSLSSVYNALGRQEDAEEQLQLILKSDSNDATANNDLGYFWADRNKNLDEAEGMIRKAIDLDRLQRSGGGSIDTDSDKDNAAYVDSLGWVLFRKGKFDEAKKELERASSLPGGEDDPVVWDHLGDVYYRQKQPEKAVEAWKKAVTLYDQGLRRKSDGRYREIQDKLLRELNK